MGSPARDQMEEIVRTIFRRCVLCPEGMPACPPSCPHGQVCSQIPKSCTKCPRTMCVAMGSAPPPPPSGGAPNAGAIAGGVIGGLIFVGIVIWLFWKYGLKNRRERESRYWSEQYQHDEQEKNYPDNFTMRRDARASTHTVASMASTVLTRASNIIQIAYIPGVTNRSGPASPQPLVPPVPPIPAASPNPGGRDSDLHFLPGDIRDSTFTDGRSSYAPSCMARDSVASTVYRSNAIVSPQPAQAVVRGKAAVVSVKAGSAEGTPATTPGPSTPAMPAVPAHLLNQQAKVKSPVVAQLGKPTAINVTRKKSGDTLTSPGDASAGAPDPNATGQTNPAIHAARAAAPSTRLDSSSLSPTSDARSPLSPVEEPSQTPESDVEDDKSPFVDSSAQKQIAEAVRRASMTTDPRSRSPFDDENAVDR